MKRARVTPLSDINRRAPEAGRIRLGVKSGKAMKSIDTFRFTSPVRAVIDQLAALYGGEARQWNDPSANPSNQFEVITRASDIRVMLVPDGCNTQYELWSGGGCQRRCDGIECEVPRVVGGDYEMVTTPCICDAQGMRDCDAKTRLTVVLPDVDFYGTWRLESKGWNAAEELPGMFDLIQTIAATGRMVEARLAVERRERMTPAGKRKFVVPRLSIAQTLDSLALGAPAPSAAGQLGPASAPALPVSSVPPQAEPIDAEILDDELLELEAKLAADANQFGLNPQAYIDAVRAQCQDDPTKDERTRIRACIQAVRSGQLEPSNVVGGRVVWVRP